MGAFRLKLIGRLPPGCRPLRVSLAFILSGGPAHPCNRSQKLDHLHLVRELGRMANSDLSVRLALDQSPRLWVMHLLPKTFISQTCYPDICFRHGCMTHRTKADFGIYSYTHPAQCDAIKVTVCEQSPSFLIECELWLRLTFIDGQADKVVNLKRIGHGFESSRCRSTAVLGSPPLTGVPFLKMYATINIQ